MKCIEEYTERLDLLERTLAVEEKRRKRLLELSLAQQKEREKAQRLELIEGNPTSNSLLNQEDTQRKQLVDNMVQNSSPSNGPIVKVLTNVQGNVLILILILFHMYIVHLCRLAQGFNLNKKFFFLRWTW